jgi:hypothetical protein
VQRKDPKEDALFPKTQTEAVTRVATYKPMVAATSPKKWHKDKTDKEKKAGFVQPAKDTKGGDRKKDIRTDYCTL